MHCIAQHENFYDLSAAQRDAQNDTIRRLMRDVEFSSGQEEKLESELFVSNFILSLLQEEQNCVCIWYHMTTIVTPDSSFCYVIMVRYFCGSCIVLHFL